MYIILFSAYLCFFANYEFVYSSKADRDIINLQDIAKKKFMQRGNKGTDITKHPHHVAIFTKHEPKNIYCGGSIIDTKWVVTSKSCNGDKVTVYAGSAEKLQGTPHKVKRVWLAPTVNSKTVRIVLLELRNHLVFGVSVQPIQIGDYKNIVVGRSGTYTGFGVIIEKGSFRHGLIEGQLTIEACRSGHRRNSTKFCASNNSKTTFNCKDVTGSGFVINRQLIGVTVHLPGCNKKGGQGVFDSVPPIKQWIESVMKRSKDVNRVIKKMNQSLRTPGPDVIWPTVTPQ